ncbi:MAG: ribonuclease III [Proteobacteria bacterium]|nr:ribonuclease III [Pseudomonadota bacterium]
MGDGSLAPADAAARDFRALEARLGHRFARPELLERALTHVSRANERGDSLLGNERLEFLGDAVLDLVVSELLMDRHPERDEGWLSRARSATVRQESLARHARELELERWMLLGRSEERSGEPKPSILANGLEALLGALYLDAGLSGVRAWIESEFGGELADPERGLADPKTRLQEWLQARGGPPPRYVALREQGPSHAPEFEVEVRVEDRALGRGLGGSKRVAEQEAARRALVELGAEPA